MQNRTKKVLNMQPNSRIVKPLNSKSHERANNSLTLNPNKMQKKLKSKKYVKPNKTTKKT